VLQTVLVPLLFASGDSLVEVIGGTHQPMAPPADYLQHIYAPALRRFGAEVEVDYGPAGYYPRGGGRVRATVSGGSLDPIELVVRGARLSLDAFVVTSGLREDVAERGSSTIAELLPEATIRALTPRAFSRGAAVTVVARHENGLAGFSSIGRPGLPMENVASEACERFMDWDRGSAACDERLADQLVLPAALARGPSRWSTPRFTEHLRTVLDVVRAFMPIQYSVSDGVVELSPG
jgi:RNA 3'-terminal phosphate cyclase (ATP)